MPESVHLCDWPAPDKKLINKNLEEKMAVTRQIVALALAERAAAGIKVRQPLATLEIKNQESKIKNDKELLKLILDEVNVKEIKFNPELKNEIKLDKKITKELKEEGMIRDLVRQIQDMRRQAGLTRKDTILLNFLVSKFPNFQKIAEKWSEFIKKETLSQELTVGGKINFDLEKDIDLELGKIKIGIKKLK